MKIRLRALILLLAAALGCSATDFGALNPEGYVSDFAHVLDPGSKQELEAYCAQVEKATGAQFALVTIGTLEGEPIEDVANVMYRKWGVGSKATNEGLLLLLVVQDRRSRLEVGYGLEPIIPDGAAGSVLRVMRPSLRAGNYAQALSDAARTLAETIAKAKGVQIGTAAPMRRTHPEPEGFPYELLVVVGGLVLLMFLFGGGRGSRSGGGGGGGGFLMGMILGQLLGGGGRTRSGGGFGGYDSGDSFGGFGGGDSGGGGASGDW